MSNRSRSSKFVVRSQTSRQSDSRHLVGSDYFELIDAKVGLEVPDESTQQALDNISGMKSNKATVHVDYRGDTDHDTPNGRIKKTVTVEQSRI